MNETPQKEIILPIPKDDVRIRSFCTPEEIRIYIFHSQFGIYAQYKSLYTKRESLEKNAELQDANVVLALANNKNIIGFGVLAYPEPGERWAELKQHTMMEIKVVEVSRDWRSSRIANGLVKMMLSHPQIEDKIVYMVGYSWTWDLDGTKKTAQEYRNMLIRLFKPHGFQEYQTNEPNICLRPENIFMGRMGKNVSKEMQNIFKWLRFGIASSQ
jgi:acetoin utilization protein AcuA